MMKNFVYILLFFSFTPMGYAQECTPESARASIQSVTDSDEGLGIISYGRFQKGDLVAIEDMIKDNHYKVTSDDALVFSAHGEYFSGYFIRVYELDARTCQILSQFLIYEE